MYFFSLSTYLFFASAVVAFSFRASARDFFLSALFTLPWYFWMRFSCFSFVAFSLFFSASFALSYQSWYSCIFLAFSSPYSAIRSFVSPLIRPSLTAFFRALSSFLFLDMRTLFAFLVYFFCAFPWYFSVLFRILYWSSRFLFWSFSNELEFLAFLLLKRLSYLAFTRSSCDDKRLKARLIQSNCCFDSGLSFVPPPGSEAVSKLSSGWTLAPSFVIFLSRFVLPFISVFIFEIFLN